jgi:type I restriction enzyme R subunit
MESYQLKPTFSGKIKLERGAAELEPQKGGSGGGMDPGEQEPLSQIIKELNDRFGTDFTQDDKIFIQQWQDKLAGDVALEASIQVNTEENARLTFDHVANDTIHEMIDSNFKFYKQITDDQDFEKFFLGWLFERYKQRGGKEAG